VFGKNGQTESSLSISPCYRLDVVEGVFDEVETSLDWLKDKLFKTSFFWDEDVFCYSLYVIVYFRDNLFLGF